MEDLSEKFIDFGALGYPVSKMASILQLNESQVAKLLKDGMQNKVTAGKDTFDYSVDKKLMEMALAGDLKALEKLERNQRIRK